MSAWKRFCRRLVQLRCRLLGGHSPVTRYDAQSVWSACYVCERVLGEGGWTTAGLRPPRRRLTSVADQLEAWRKKHGVAA